MMERVYVQVVRRRTERDVRELLPHLPETVTRADIRAVLSRVAGRNSREFLAVERRLQEAGWLIPLPNGVFDRNGRPLRRWQRKEARR